MVHVFMSHPLTSAESSSLSYKGSRALIVDDHEDSARGLAAMLDVLGFETEVAMDGIDALRHATTFQPDLLLLDITMPKLDGYDTCGVIRAQPWGKSACLIAVSGHSPEELRERAGKAGFDAFLSKPVEMSSLRGAVQKFFQA